jgi:hypothetical protein
LEYGSGGGFTGSVTAYKIIGATVYQINSAGKITAKGHLDDNRRKKIQKMAKSLLLAKTSFDHPYNMYQYLVIYTRNKIVNIKWGDPSYPPTREIKEFSHNIHRILQSIKFKSL